jgi:hypothetical protein
MKCVKKVFVIVIDKTQPNSQFCNFYSGLKAAGCCYKNYLFDPVFVDPNTKCWDKCVLKKINCVIDKYGCKPYLVSGLYDADLELKLAQFALLVCKILLATTVEGVASLSNIELLPTGSDCSTFTSANYLNENKYARALNICGNFPPIVCGTYYKTSTSNAVVSNNDTNIIYSKELPQDLDENDLIVSLSKDCCEIEWKYHPFVSDDAAYQLVKENAETYPYPLIFDETSNTIYREPAEFVKLPDFDCSRCVFLAAGIWVNADNTLEANQLKVLGSRLCYWLKCNC